MNPRHVTLYDGRLTSLTKCFSLFWLVKVVTFRLCLCLLGLMASVISVVHLGLLIMRDFQCLPAPKPQCKDNTGVWWLSTHGGTLQIVHQASRQGWCYVELP